MREWSADTSSAAETRALGRLLGRLLTPPAILLLSGDLGAGKTSLVQGLATGLGVPPEEPVTSPSYTLLNIHSGRFPLYHFDLYRLSLAEDLLDLGIDEYLQGEGVTVIEWADRVPGLEGDLLLRLFHLGGERRRIVFEAAGERQQEFLDSLAQAWRERGTEDD